MNKIISPHQAIELSNQLHTQDKTIVLAGGCFDILHAGHIDFLKAAKSHGDTLLILLESDASVTKRKGKMRPINPQTARAQLLASLPSVDYVIVLQDILKDKEYDDLVLRVKPAIIATTKNDPYKGHKERQAKLLSTATVVEVIKRLPQYSTSDLAKVKP